MPSPLEICGLVPNRKQGVLLAWASQSSYVISYVPVESVNPVWFVRMHFVPLTVQPVGQVYVVFVWPVGQQYALHIGLFWQSDSDIHIESVAYEFSIQTHIKNAANNSFFILYPVSKRWFGLGKFFTLTRCGNLGYYWRVGCLIQTTVWIRHNFLYLFTQILPIMRAI